MRVGMQLARIWKQPVQEWNGDERRDTTNEKYHTPTRRILVQKRNHAGYCSACWQACVQRGYGAAAMFGRGVFCDEGEEIWQSTP